MVKILVNVCHGNKLGSPVNLALAGIAAAISCGEEMASQTISCAPEAGNGSAGILSDSVGPYLSSD